MYKHSNGAKYTGCWLDDAQDGYGIYSKIIIYFVIKNKISLFQGYDYNQISKFYFYLKFQRKLLSFLSFNLKGIETWMDGSCYQGEYKKGKKHGLGTYQWTDGSKYEGQWEDNCLNGYVNFLKILTKI